MTINVIWFVLALAMASGVNHWRHAAALESLASARAGDRGKAETWILRRLREHECRLHEAKAYLQADSRKFVARPDFLSVFVAKLYEGGAAQVEICDAGAPEAALPNFLVISLPEGEEAQEGVIADAHSFVRRDALVYGRVPEAEVEELVREATLVGERRVMVRLPGVPDSPAH